MTLPFSWDYVCLSRQWDGCPFNRSEMHVCVPVYVCTNVPVPVSTLFR